MAGGSGTGKCACVRAYTGVCTHSQKVLFNVKVMSKDSLNARFAARELITALGLLSELSTRAARVVKAS